MKPSASSLRPADQVWRSSIKIMEFNGAVMKITGPKYISWVGLARGSRSGPFLPSWTRIQSAAALPRLFAPLNSKQMQQHLVRGNPVP